MKRYAEAVLNGHPDKFCDILADRILLQTYQHDNRAYGQLEVAVWSDQIFLTGALVTDQSLKLDTSQIIRDTGLEIGYTPENHIDAAQYKVHDHICRVNARPEKWTGFVNDQCIIHGYAGYDFLTRFLPPEQFAVWFIREQLMESCRAGALKGCGPDGKLLLIIQEYPGEWVIESLLVVLQQPAHISYTDFLENAALEIDKMIEYLIRYDSRWRSKNGLRVLINPNGPFLNGGSDGDNGQTGRKLVMDYYGPRVALGGGALHGKDLTHIDRLGAQVAREICVDVLKGKDEQSQVPSEVFLAVSYAPGLDQPLDYKIKTYVRPEIELDNRLNFQNMLGQVNRNGLNYNLADLGSFYRTANSIQR